LFDTPAVGQVSALLSVFIASTPCQIVFGDSCADLGLIEQLGLSRLRGRRRPFALCSTIGFRSPNGVQSTESDRPDNMHSLSPYQVHWVSILLAVVAAATASGQTSGGAIRGTVSDPSVAVVPGAGITIEEISTSENWRLVSSSAGLYNAPDLPVGRYNVTVKATGFSTAERTDIDV